jgi:hypothetical protein
MSQVCSERYRDRGHCCHLFVVSLRELAGGTAAHVRAIARVVRQRLERQADTSAVVALGDSVRTRHRELGQASTLAEGLIPLPVGELTGRSAQSRHGWH